MSIDRENYLHKEIYKKQIPNLIKRSLLHEEKSRLLFFFYDLKITSLFLECYLKSANLLVITELKSVKEILKLFRLKDFVLHKTEKVQQYNLVISQ